MLLCDCLHAVKIELLMASLVRRDLIEEEGERGIVNFLPFLSLLADVLLRACQTIVLVGSLATQESLLSGPHEVKLDGPDVGKAHERGRELLSVWLAITQEGTQHGRMVVTRHVTEVVIIELGFMGPFVLAPAEQREGYRSQCYQARQCQGTIAKDDGRLSLGVCLVCPALLLGENRLELAHVDCLRV